MKYQQLMLIFSFALVQYVLAVCNVCNDNGVACINDREFHLCENRMYIFIQRIFCLFLKLKTQIYGIIFVGQAKTSTTYSCSEGKLCTQHAMVCMEETNASVVQACGDTSNCGVCEGDGTYACTSRTTYTMCFEGTLSDIRDTCPENRMCDISLGKRGQNPCVPNCREPDIQFCDLHVAIDEPATTTVLPTTTTITPTSSPPTTTTPSVATSPQSPEAAVCAQQTATGRYPLPNDSTCRK